METSASKRCIFWLQLRLRKDFVSNQIFASKYLHYIPEKETLIREVEKCM